MKKIKVGTRPSALALTQTQIAIDQLALRFPEIDFEKVIISTSGDSKQTASTSVQRDKRDWIEELELALLKGEIDLAVHSAKDVPFDVSSDTKIQSVMNRADCRDIFIGRKKDPHDQAKSPARISFTELPQKATIGTSSLRRRAQLLILRPDLQIKELRGNVPTRIAKLDNFESGYDGIVLASAGLQRLGICTESMDLVPTELMLPASAQGILCVQYRSDRVDLSEMAQSISNPDTEAALLAERSTVRCLEADCASAVAVNAYVAAEKIAIIAKVFSHCGSEFIEQKISGERYEAEKLGIELGKRLLAQGARQLLDDPLLTNFFTD